MKEETKRATKTAQVSKYLQEHKHITTYDAFMKFNATRLSAIIFNLRKRGYLIVTNDVTTKDCNGNTVVYADYELCEKNKGE